MPRSRVPLSLLAVLLATLGACHSAPERAGQLACTLVLIKTGSRTEPLSKEENTKAFAGHFANMERLAKAGHLLVAGPYGEGRSDKALRGIFVLDTPDRARARELAESDPAFQAGVFLFEFHDFVTQAPLRAYIQDELAAREAAERAGKKLSPGEGGRTYVWLTAVNGAEAAAALAGNPAVLLQARLDETKWFVLLDAVDVAAANALLEPLGARLGPYVLDGWFGSRKLTSLPQRQG